MSLFAVSGVTPITTEEDYNLDLPLPHNLNDRQFARLIIKQDANATDIIKQQEVVIDNNTKTLENLIGDLAKLEIKNDQLKQDNDVKTKRIDALEQMLKALTNNHHNLKADHQVQRQQLGNFLHIHL